jgi:diguanylate cyclase (GGDEF)-like protein
MVEAWKKEVHAGQEMALIMIDIDHFKRINDTFGHAVGDQVLINVANTLKQDLHPHESIYRMGGEEFLFLSATTTFKQLILSAERLRRRVAALETDLDDDSLRVTISLGVAQRTEEQGRFDILLVHADQALYAAKANGRNRIHVYRNKQIVPLPRPGQ